MRGRPCASQEENTHKEHPQITYIKLTLLIVLLLVIQYCTVINYHEYFTETMQQNFEATQDLESVLSNYSLLINSTSGASISSDVTVEKRPEKNETSNNEEEEKSFKESTTTTPAPNWPKRIPIDFGGGFGSLPTNTTKRKNKPQKISKEITVRETKEKITIIIQGYDEERFKNFDTFLPYYLDNLPVDKILIVWNNNNTVRSKLDKYKQKSSKIDVVFPSRNTVHNRFLMQDHVQTKLCLTIDDDMMISKLYAKCMVNTFEWFYPEFHVLGWDARSGKRKPDGSWQYLYFKNGDGSYGMIITGTMMFECSLMHDYEVLSAPMIDMYPLNGEDIMMNAVSSMKYHAPPLHVGCKTTTENCWRRDLYADGGLSIAGDPKAWNRLRDNVLTLGQNLTNHPYVEHKKYVVCPPFEKHESDQYFSFKVIDEE